MELLKEKPGLELQHLYGKYGELEKALYDPNEPYKKYRRDPELRPKIGENFPEFVFKTIEGEEFGKDQLNEKWVLIHFNHLTQFIKKPVWDKLYLDLQKAKKNYSIECFSLFAYEEDLKTSFGEYQPIIHLVNNGRGFFERYHIIKSPTSVLINPDGLVIQYYFESEAIEFLPFLETQEKHHLNQPN
ncbi:hypothetical protein SAMN05444394_0229 [Algoriphagus halophilus]|uniref:Peroxiredoxin n=2 Tax=Algoriphagus halophilus TaxID=226505 RepID=A0A1N6D5E6_9BACT|nr:hypothetical protein SAMN05444394_0229 [Algoriphagus halophilus]